MIATQGLTEVILCVQDIQKEVQFYRDVLGLKVAFPKNMKDYSQEHRVMLEAGNCLLALHAGGKGQVGEDCSKIVFRVTDIDVAHHMLVERGVQIGEVCGAAPGVWICDGFDPEGHPFSIECQETQVAI